MRSGPRNVCRPGHGVYARRRRESSAAEQVQSAAPSSRRIGRQNEASPSWGRAESGPAASPRSVSTSSSPPIEASRDESSPAVSLSPIAHAPLEIDGSGVEALLHPHRVDAGLGVAGENRRLDRRGAAVPRQERGVHVHAPQARQPQDLVREDPAEGDDGDRVGPRRLERREQLRVAPHRLRLLDRDAARGRERADRGRPELRVAADGAVGLRDDERHGEASVDERAERRHGEVGRAEEDDAERKRSWVGAVRRLGTSDERLLERVRRGSPRRPRARRRAPGGGSSRDGARRGRRGRGRRRAPAH